MRAAVATGPTLAAVLALVPATAFAHPGDGGVLHLFTSADHLATIAMGAILAWQVGRHALRLGSREPALRR